ncbi:unnamed protein product [Boreogadus saida]
MEEKGIVDRGCLPPEPRCRGTTASASFSAEAVVPRQREAGLKRETFKANNPFLLYVVVHVLQGVKAKNEPHAACCRAVVPRGNRQQAACRSSYFKESKPKFLFPQFLLNLG